MGNEKAATVEVEIARESTVRAIAQRLRHVAAWLEVYVDMIGRQISEQKMWCEGENYLQIIIWRRGLNVE